MQVGKGKDGRTRCLADQPLPSAHESRVPVEQEDIFLPSISVEGVAGGTGERFDDQVELRFGVVVSKQPLTAVVGEHLVKSVQPASVWVDASPSNTPVGPPTRPAAHSRKRALSVDLQRAPSIIFADASRSTPRGAMARSNQCFAWIGSAVVCSS